MAQSAFKEQLIAVDIDQTLADGLVAAHLTFYNQELGLGMSPQEIAHAGMSYAKTFDVPQIIAYRSQNEARFQAAREKVRTSEVVNMALEVIPGSPQGIDFLLSTYANAFAYYTVRPNETQAVTTAWLAQNNFPKSDHVIICDGHADKIQKILQDTPAGATAVLIDDNLPKLLEAAEAEISDPKVQARLQDLRIIGFGSWNEYQQASLKAQGKKIGIKVDFMTHWEISLLQVLFKQEIR